MQEAEQGGQSEDDWEANAESWEDMGAVPALGPAAAQAKLKVTAQALWALATVSVVHISVSTNMCLGCCGDVCIFWVMLPCGHCPFHVCINLSDSLSSLCNSNYDTSLL